MKYQHLMAKTLHHIWSYDYYIYPKYWDTLTSYHTCPDILTLVMLNPDIPAFANSVDPYQLASEEANWSGSALFAIKYMNL